MDVVSAARSWSPGDSVLRYTLLARIAVGGMAEIWLARQAGPAGFEKLVVIKRIIDSYSADPAFVQMFLDEARIAAQLSHPNIVQTYDLGEHRGAWFIAMEYVGGEHLGAVMSAQLRRGPLPMPLGARIVALAAEGLSHAHTRTTPAGAPLNIVHRDVSPQNLVVTYDGQVKVVDFGIAKAANRVSHTDSGLVKGKLSYMSPEQVRGKELDARTDVYALGVVLYELLTGERLLKPTDPVLALQQLTDATPTPLASRKNPSVPDALAQIAGRALEKDRANRYQTAAELKDALEAWLHSQGRVPTSSDLSAFMRGLFAERIEDRTRLLKQASTGELTQSDADRLGVATTVGTPSISQELQGAKRANRFLWVAVAGLLVAVAGGVTMFLASQTPSPPPAPASAKLRIETDPPGAELTLDGQAVGRSPLELTGISPGPHHATATLSGHSPAAKEVSTVAGENASLMFALKPLPPAPNPSPEPSPNKPDSPRDAPPARPKGRLTLSTTPWTHVSLNGRPLGDTPLVEISLPTGKHQLKLTSDHPKFSRTIEVEIRANQLTTKKLTFEP